MSLLGQLMVSAVLTFGAGLLFREILHSPLSARELFLVFWLVLLFVKLDCVERQVQRRYTRYVRF
ncbi:MAG: hypothetical protein QMC81_09385 [Thermoanaerobacterales bacterium]|nr:hypothetical protein [Bacillota bacterium]MDI6907676.1 hypothetical protein [Thermoanaerobacterales bacterium]